MRTIVQVYTDSGLVGLGEMGGGGESAELAFRMLKEYLLGHDPLDLEALKWKIANPTASLYNNRTQLLAAVEFACLDIAGKALGVPVWTLLGGKLRDRVPFASYLFYRYLNQQTGAGGEETPAEMVAHARDLVAKHGFRTHKLKGGVFPAEHDVAVYRALAEAFPGHSFRLDPNAIWSVEESVWVAKQIGDVRNDYLEDPTWGLDGMRRVRERIDIPTATNTVVVNFEELAQCIRQDAVDVILLDTTFWGGVRACLKAAATCETFQWGIAVHSSGELGIQLATMLHLGAALPNLRFAADAHYHHLTDDVIVGGLLPYVEGSIAVPDGPGLGVELDDDRLGRYAELYRQLGGYRYDRDPERPDWFAILPGQTYAVPRARPPQDAPTAPPREQPLVHLGQVQMLVSGLDHPECVAYGPDGNLYAGGEAGQIYRVPVHGQPEQIATTGGFILGVTLDGRGNVYACDVGRKQVLRVTPPGEVTVLSSGTRDAPMRNPNFSVFDRHGRLYVTDSGEWQHNDGLIFRIDPDGSTHVVSRAAHRFPNGLALSADGRWLYVAESTLPGVTRLPVGDDGSLGVLEDVVLLPGDVPDGLALDISGNLYIACYRPDRIYRWSPATGLQVVAEDPAGTVLASPTNLAFYGPDLDRLGVANLGRWHLATLSTDVPGQPLVYPRLGTG